MKSAIPKTARINGTFKRSMVPMPRILWRARPALVVPPVSAAAESFRLLSLNVLTVMANSIHHAIAVFSANPGDGRSFVATNLAVAMSEETPVLLVEPGLPAGPSLRDRLTPSHDGAVQTLNGRALATEYPGVVVWSRPVLSANGSAGGLGRVLTQASNGGYFTIVDAPPALTSAAAFSLAREVRYVVYVVRGRPQDMGVHRQIREQLKRLKVEILGLVINEV